MVGVGARGYPTHGHVGLVGSAVPDFREEHRLAAFPALGLLKRSKVPSGEFVCLVGIRYPLCIDTSPTARSLSYNAPDGTGWSLGGDHEKSS